jgi:hypothetical protein
MRINDILNEGDILIPGSGNTINIIVGSEEETKEKVNPGIRYNNDGLAKWSPPLQQHLDVVKDAVGPTNTDTTIEPESEDCGCGGSEEHSIDDEEDQDPLDIIKRLAAIITPKPSALG